MNHLDDNFSFFVPATLEKGKSSDGKDEMRIRGVANSESAVDSDGETLEPMGFDYDPLLRTGFFNWDHQSKKTSSAIVGEPTHAQLINKGRDFYVEGILYPDSEEARNIYSLGLILEKNSKTRRLGFSIEGQVIERGCGPEFYDEEKTQPNPSYDPKLWKRVKRARVTGIAITPCPKNPNTFMQIVKGESPTPLMQQEYDEDVVKAMEVDQKLTPHNPSPEVKADDQLSTCCQATIVNGKCTECGQEVGKSFKKSEIYELIADRYTTDIEKAKQIYHFIKSVNQKLFPMSKEKVSQEAITKAFEFLNAGEEALQKSQTENLSAENKDAFDPTSIEKATDLCKSFEGDLTKGQVVDKLVGAGYAEDTAFEAAKGFKKPEVKKVEVVIEKSQDNTLESKTDETAELIKSLGDSMSTRFQALGNIMKFQMDQNEALKDQNELLKSQLDQLTENSNTLTARLTKVENTPLPPKSLRNVSATERFQKSEDKEEIIPAGTTVYDMKKSEDVNAFTDVLFNECVELKGRNQSYAHLEKAIQSIEISQSCPASLIPWARSRGIILKG